MNLYDIVKITTQKIADLAITTAKIANNAVTNQKLAQANGLSVLGTAGGPGNPGYISASSADSVLRRDGITLGFGQIKAGAIQTGSITAPKLSGIQGGSAPIYGIRAWVGFNGTGSIGANQFIEADGNVASVVKISTGHYRINFTTEMQDDNYCCIGTTSDTFGADSSVTFINGEKTNSSVEIKTYYSTNNLGDFSRVWVTIIR